MDNQDLFAARRQQMVAEQLKGRGITDERVLAAMATVPRHLFVGEEQQVDAYSDMPLPIGNGQTISQPYIVAFMLQELQLGGSERVLEVGTGSGYQAALLGELAAEVYSVERHERLAAEAEERLRVLGFSNVRVHVGDGSAGWADKAPYDAIVVAASAPVVPQPLLDQLAPSGRLIIPVGEPGRQNLQLWHRETDGFGSEDLTGVAFVPLIGKHGWS
jgi:protein-L-isoaspartate(D-aspartate) O-methyltransferase